MENSQHSSEKEKQMGEMRKKDGVVIEESEKGRKGIKMYLGMGKSEQGSHGYTIWSKVC